MKRTEERLLNYLEDSLSDAERECLERDLTADTDAARMLRDYGRLLELERRLSLERFDASPHVAGAVMERVCRSASHHISHRRFITIGLAVIALGMTTALFWKNDLFLADRAATDVAPFEPTVVFEEEEPVEPTFAPAVEVSTSTANIAADETSLPPVAAQPAAAPSPVLPAALVLADPVTGAECRYLAVGAAWRRDGDCSPVPASPLGSEVLRVALRQTSPKSALGSAKGVQFYFLTPKGEENALLRADLVVLAESRGDSTPQQHWVTLSVPRRLGALLRALLRHGILAIAESTDAPRIVNLEGCANDDRICTLRIEDRSAELIEYSYDQDKGRWLQREVTPSVPGASGNP